MSANLRLDGVVVTRECFPVEDDLASCGSRSVETRHEEVQVDSKSVHDDNFRG